MSYHNNSMQDLLSSMQDELDENVSNLDLIYPRASVALLLQIQRDGINNREAKEKFEKDKAENLAKNEMQQANLLKMDKPIISLKYIFDKLNKYLSEYELGHLNNYGNDNGPQGLLLFKTKLEKFERKLKNYQFDINASFFLNEDNDEIPKTLLCHFAANPKPHFNIVIEFLLKCGANVNPAFDLDLPVESVLFNGDLDRLKILMRYGLDPNSKCLSHRLFLDNSGLPNCMTPLEWHTVPSNYYLEMHDHYNEIPEIWYEVARDLIKMGAIITPRVIYNVFQKMKQEDSADAIGEGLHYQLLRLGKITNVQTLQEEMLTLLHLIDNYKIKKNAFEFLLEETLLPVLRDQSKQIQLVQSFKSENIGQFFPRWIVELILQYNFDETIADNVDFRAIENYINKSYLASYNDKCLGATQVKVDDDNIDEDKAEHETLVYVCDSEYSNANNVKPDTLWLFTGYPSKEYEEIALRNRLRLRNE